MAIELDWWVNTIPVVYLLPAISNAISESALPKDYFPALNVSPIRNLGRGRMANMHPVSINSAGDLYQMRYAARNRLCVLLQYKGVLRLVEPYSLRQPSTGNVLLYAYELFRDEEFSQQIKAFKLHEIESIEITKDSFDPKYLIEL